MAFSEHGQRPRRFPKAMGMLLDTAARREARLIAPFLDKKFYLENNSDVAEAGIDAAYHYAKYGWREGRDPSPSFSTTGYLAAHPRIAMEGANPLLHFIQQGKAAERDGQPEDETFEAEVALVESGIDAGFYASSYPGFRASGLSAARHYCRTGWREGHDPAPDFSTSYYLSTNPDIRESGVNPFWHYLIAGRDEGRLPAHPGGWRHAVLSRQTSFDVYCDDWLRDDGPPELMDRESLVLRLEQARVASGLLVSLGHDDYRATPGGVQLCVEIEEHNAAAHGVDYLNLHPWQPLPKLAEAEDDYVMCLVMNGHMLGAASVSTVIDALKQTKRDYAGARIIVHHLAGHAPERVVDIAAALRVESAQFWLHDYFTLCTSYALQRNNVTPCNVPAPTSNASHICLFGAARRRQESRIAKLFERLDIHLISPSEIALDFWSKRTALSPASATVHPHVELTATSGGKEAVPPDTPVRIGFIGTPAVHKGWPVFRELERRLSATGLYEFWFFGSSDPHAEGIRHCQTHVRATDPESTSRAVAANGIDLVLHWASWPETFSFSTFEALGGGAFVITNRGSGNVAAAVEKFDRGVVLDDTDALYALAKSGGLETLATRAREARRRETLSARFSGMSHDVTRLEDVA